MLKNLWKVPRKSNNAPRLISINNKVKEQEKQILVDTDYALKLYIKAHNQDLDLREQQLSDSYKPSVRLKQGGTSYVGGMALALGLAVCSFFWTII